MLTKRFNDLQRQAEVVTVKKNTMTKKEIRNAINKAVYIYAESLGYTMSDDNDGSCVTFYKFQSDACHDFIDYSRSQHDTYVLNHANDEARKNAELIREYAKQQVLNYQQ